MQSEMFKQFRIFLEIFILLVNIEHLLVKLLLEVFIVHLHYSPPCLLAKVRMIRLAI